MRPITALNKNSHLPAKGAMCMEMIAQQLMAGCQGKRPSWKEEISNDGWMVKCSDWVDNTPEGLIFFLPIQSLALWILPSVSGNLWNDHFGLLMNTQQVTEYKQNDKGFEIERENVLNLGLRKNNNCYAILSPKIIATD